MGYTWAQFTAYLRMARAQAAQRRIDSIVDNSNAFAGGKAAGELVKALRKTADA